MRVILSWIPFLVGWPSPGEHLGCPPDVQLTSNCSGIELLSPISTVSSAGSVAGWGSCWDLAYHLRPSCSVRTPVHHHLLGNFLLLLTFYRLIVIINEWNSSDANYRGHSRQGIELSTLPDSQHKRTCNIERHMIVSYIITKEHTISDR